MARDKTLLAQLEEDVLDHTRPIADALRKCVVLGGHAGSTVLRDWATKELSGYKGDDELPEYRTVAAPILVDAATVNAIVRRQRIAPSALPDFVQERVDEHVQLRGGIGELEALARRADQTSEAVDISLPMAADVARVMNHEIGDPYQNIHSIYWSITGAALHGVIDQVRTRLAQLVAELRATTPADQAVPSAAAATQAVHVAISGRRHNVTVTTAQSSEGASASIAAADADPPTESPFWTRSRRIGAFLVGLAGIVGAVVAVIEFL